MPTITLYTEINAPIEIVFDLSRSIDLHKISTADTDEEAIEGVTSGLIGLNEFVTWRAKHFGVYQSLTSKITEFTYPTFFVDEMTQGIFRNLRHEHIFSSSSSEQTMMKDVFTYTSPLGLLGKLADYLFLKKYLTKVLSQRNEVIKEFAESERWREILSQDA
ncbi:MAG: SRPBCC family protein [Bacteroidia bacterium]